jgi:hypothetical protein
LRNTYFVNHPSIWTCLMSSPIRFRKTTDQCCLQLNPLLQMLISIIWLCYFQYEFVPLGLVFHIQLFTYLLIFIYMDSWLQWYIV